MSTGPPQGKINDSGFTVLQDAVHNPEVDIIFVHGLQGHPEKTWSAIKKADQDTPASKKTKGGIRTWFSRLLRRRSGAKEAQADCKEESQSISERSSLPGKILRICPHHDLRIRFRYCQACQHGQLLHY
ncbi:unnamed protein product [Aspergillus oryzae var. brunneus]|uniref:Unnamed protein product n=1 Tax=Aspergillus oryzae var. brunneus TaxID=332754 RepID=A0ABQ6KWM8_ASPOZ|nr:unnamed protein product [Aspergillus oryzae]GMG48104.1 unnamed protein product [Aspergillus oryzae var. brunneus]